MRISIVIKEETLPLPDIIILEAKAVRPGAGTSTCVILPGFCFKLTSPLPKTLSNNGNVQWAQVNKLVGNLTALIPVTATALAPEWN
jgi:hypothetical protein